MKSLTRLCIIRINEGLKDISLPLDCKVSWVKIPHRAALIGVVLGVVIVSFAVASQLRQMFAWYYKAVYTIGFEQMALVVIVAKTH